MSRCCRARQNHLRSIRSRSHIFPRDNHDGTTSHPCITKARSLTEEVFLILPRAYKPNSTNTLPRALDCPHRQSSESRHVRRCCTRHPRPWCHPGRRAWWCPQLLYQRPDLRRARLAQSASDRYLLGHIFHRFKAYNSPTGQSSIQREWDTYNPLTDPTDSFLSCNTNGANLGSGQLSATVPAGSEVTAYWK